MSLIMYNTLHEPQLNQPQLNPKSEWIILFTTMSGGTGHHAWQIVQIASDADGDDAGNVS